MTNSSGSRRGRRGGLGIVSLAAVAAVFGVVLFGSVSSASASSVLCQGNLLPENAKKPSVDAKIDFTCSEDIRGFSVTTNKAFDFFGTELDVFKPDGSGSSEAAIIQCEGNVPGPGFGCGTTNRDTPTGCQNVTGPTANQVIGPACANKVSAGNTAEMKVGFPVNPCKHAGPYGPGKDKLRVWLSVLTEPLIGSFNASALNQTAYTRGTYISEPFKINVSAYAKCNVGGGKGKSRAKSKKAGAGLELSALEVRSW